MQASLSKVRALRKESAAAHDYNDYGGPTCGGGEDSFEWGGYGDGEDSFDWGGCGGGEDSPAAHKPQPPPRPGRELGTKRRR